jgi:Rrf2 family protein
MKISAKAEYACLAVLELALRFHRQEPVRLTDIAQPNNIPERFLVQILLQLKGAGYVQSLRGASGGYRLAVDPEKISLWDVIHIISGPSFPGMDEPESATRGVGWQILRNVWHEVNRQEREYLEQTNFAQLLEQVRQHDTNMYYI